MSQWDCIIVGAGPAGASAAYHLAKAGHSVLVLEKESLPRYKPCGGGVSPAIAAWFDFDFAPAVAHKIAKVRYTWKQGDPVEIALPVAEPMWMIRREVFDRFLVEQAVSKGARINDGVAVAAIATTPEGLEVRSGRGETYTGRYAIAAAGTSASLIEGLGFKQRQNFSAAVWEIPSDAPPAKTAHFDFGSLKNGILWSFPKADGYSLSAGYFRKGGQPEALRKELENHAKAAGLDVKAGRFYEHPMSLWTQRDSLHSDRVLLAGDAIAIADPLTAEGIRPAMFSGVEAAKAIHLALEGDTTALANYTQTIDEQWSTQMAWAQRLAGLYYQFPKVVYKVAIKRPTAARAMSQILCGESSYSDVAEDAMKRLRQKMIPGRG